VSVVVVSAQAAWIIGVGVIAIIVLGGLIVWVKARYF